MCLNSTHCQVVQSVLQEFAFPHLPWRTTVCCPLCGPRSLHSFGSRTSVDLPGCVFCRGVRGDKINTSCSLLLGAFWDLVLRLTTCSFTRMADEVDIQLRCGSRFLLQAYSALTTASYNRSCGVWCSLPTSSPLYSSPFTLTTWHIPIYNLLFLFDSDVKIWVGWLADKS